MKHEIWIAQSYPRPDRPDEQLYQCSCSCHWVSTADGDTTKYKIHTYKGAQKAFIDHLQDVILALEEKYES